MNIVSVRASFASGCSVGVRLALRPTVAKVGNGFNYRIQYGNTVVQR